MSCCSCSCSVVFFSCYGDHRDLHVLTHSFPNRRASDLAWSGMPTEIIEYDRAPRAAGTTKLDYLSLLGLAFQGITSFSIKPLRIRSEEHTSELQSLMRISYAVFCLKKTTTHTQTHIKP